MTVAGGQAWVFAVGVPAFALHLVSIALMKALQSYSRSLFEERCAERGLVDRADDVFHNDERTERSAETLAVLTGLVLAGLIGLVLGRSGTVMGGSLVIAAVMAIGFLGYVMAGVVGEVFAEPIIDALWPAATFLRAIASPLTWGLRLVEGIVEGLAGPERSAPRPASYEVEIPSEDESDDEDSEPELPEAARVLLQRAVGLTRTDVAELMTPRNAIVSLPSTISAEKAAATFRQTGLSRVPIYGENRDDVVGILYAKDLFARVLETRSFTGIDPSELVRPAHFVPETKNAFELLDELRLERKHVAIVLDEYGGVAGLVTLEDLVEALVGSIDDEHDKLPESDSIVALGGGRYLVDARLPLDEVNERLGIELPTNGDFETVGGLAFHALGRLPEPGESFPAFGVVFTVAEVSDHAIKRLEIAPPHPAGVESL